MTKLPMRKTTIGNDPFEAVIPLPAKEESPPIQEVEISVGETQAPLPPEPREAVRQKKEPAPSPAPVPTSRRRQKLTIHLEHELAERIKNAAYWNPRLTIAKIAELGIRSAIERVEKEHGGRYPQRESELLGGRPIK